MLVLFDNAYFIFSDLGGKSFAQQIKYAKDQSDFIQVYILFITVFWNKFQSEQKNIELLNFNLQPEPMKILKETNCL